MKCTVPRQDGRFGVGLVDRVCLSDYEDIIVCHGRICARRDKFPLTTATTETDCEWFECCIISRGIMEHADFQGGRKDRP